MGTVTEQHKLATAVATGVTPKPKAVRAPAKTLATPEASFLKIASFAWSGSGKTFFLVGLLEAGLKIYVAETDMGGSGLATVRSELARRGKLELLRNIAFKDFGDPRGSGHKHVFKYFGEFLDDPGGESVQTPEGSVVSLFDWDPDMVAWEGVSNFQNRHIKDYILSFDARGNEDKVSDIRKAGLSLEGFGDFGALLQQTTSCLDRFLSIHNNKTGKRYHKYVTFQADGQDTDLITQEVKRGPMIDGKARNHLISAFDLIFEIRARKSGTTVNYEYVCDLGGSSIAKKRGLNINPVEPADSCALWKKLTEVPA